LTYLRAGTDRVCTSWIPIGDIPVEMGGLIYLEGSDALGRKLEAEFSAKNAHLLPEERISAYNKNMTETGWLTKDLPSLADRLDSRWLMADYEAGDMVVHSPYMIHASTSNTRMTMRLSTDIRYQLVRDEIDPRWTTNWSPDDKL
jgi:ectoine hydroxylase-related dioxygenase (phytanoyl-CoA dioxygenase family)